MNEHTPRRLDIEGGAEMEYRDALTLLGAVRRRLAALMEIYEDGHPEAASEIAASHGKLEDALRKAFETEKRYNDWLAKQSGQPRSGELDLAALRDQIGCRLARLRAG